MQSGSTMPPSEAVYRSLRNTAAVLYNVHGLDHGQVDAVMRESFAQFYVGRALEGAFPRRYVDELTAAVERQLACQLKRQSLSTFARVSVRSLLDRFRRAAT